MFGAAEWAGRRHVLSDYIMQMENAPRFLPMELAVQHYQKWNCEILCVAEGSLYFKCLHGTGSVEFTNGNTFQGSFHHGLMTGTGIYKWTSGITYAGSFSNNTVTGNGTIIWPNGSTYIGQVLNGHRHGSGTYYCKSDNSTYTGQWLNGLKHGRGSLAFENQSVYEGDFKEGKRHGQGRMRYSSGNEYEGGWVEDHKVGEGTMTWGKTHQKYTGGWDNDQQEGQGSYCWFDSRNGNKIVKTVYKGGWKQGKRHGFGSFFYNNGCRFEGYFQDNHKHGKSILTDQFGDIKMQTYHHDRPILTKKIQGTGKAGDTPTIANPYPQYIDIKCALIDGSIHNFLLRENSRLIGLYRSISCHRDHYTGVTLDGLHRLFKQARVLDECVSLAAIDREFALGAKHLFSLDMPDQQKVMIASQDSDGIKCQDYSKIELLRYHQQLKGESKEVSRLSSPHRGREDIHEQGRIMLYRHFVTYLLHFCLLQHRRTSQSVRKILEDLLQSFSNSQNTTRSDAHTMESAREVGRVPEEYSALNKRVLDALNAEKPVISNRIDHTANVRQIYAVLSAVGVLKETNDRMHFLEGVEKGEQVGCCLLRRENKHLYAQWEETVLSSPQFLHVMNYELTEGELNDVLYAALCRKIAKDSLPRYQEIIGSVVAHIRGKRRREHCGKVRHVENQKDKARRELLGRLEEEEQRQGAVEEQRKEERREQEERKSMAREDTQWAYSFHSPHPSGLDQPGR